jgi:hypothetical protein
MDLDIKPGDILVVFDGFDSLFEVTPNPGDSSKAWYVGGSIRARCFFGGRCKFSPYQWVHVSEIVKVISRNKVSV